MRRFDSDKPHRCPDCWRVWLYYPDSSRRFGWRWFGLGGRVRWWHCVTWWRCPYCGVRFAAWAPDRPIISTDFREAANE